jgi:hypothetical protein
MAQFGTSHMSVFGFGRSPAIQHVLLTAGSPRAPQFGGVTTGVEQSLPDHPESQVQVLIFCVFPLQIASRGVVTLAAP